jgi:hypothetical protein
VGTQQKKVECKHSINNLTQENTRRGSSFKKKPYLQKVRRKILSDNTQIQTKTQFISLVKKITNSSILTYHRRQQPIKRKIKTPRCVER